MQNCYLLQSHVGIIICILAQPVRKADPNGGEGVYRNSRTAVDVVQNDGGIRPEVCKPIFVGTDPDLYIRRWAAEKLRDGNGITKYYIIRLPHRTKSDYLSTSATLAESTCNHGQGTVDCSKDCPIEQPSPRGRMEDQQAWPFPKPV